MQRKKEKIYAVYGEGSVADKKGQKQFVKFCAGDFSLDVAPQSCRPVEVDCRDQIKTIVENNQHSTMWEIADILKISKLIKFWVKMKNVSFILQKKCNRLFGQPSIC